MLPNKALSSCGFLTVVTVGMWLLLAAPAWFLSGAHGLEGLTFAAVLCLLPGWLVFLMASRYRVAKMQATVILMGSVFRILIVLLGSLLIRSIRTHLGFREFLVWVIVFYLVALGVETFLLVKQSTSQHSPLKS